jgi:hypothetical protein
MVSILLTAFPSYACAQTVAWSVGLIGGDTLSGCTPQALKDTLIILVCSEAVVSLPVDSIDYLARHQETHFWAGAGYGTLIGASLGALVGLLTYEKPEPGYGQWFTIDFGPGANALGGAIVGAVGGFVIGGAIGESTGGDEIYKLSGKLRQQKLEIIREVMFEQK